MGAGASKEEEVFLDALDTPGGSKAPPTTKLYHRVSAKGVASPRTGAAAAAAEKWELAASKVSWNFVQEADADEGHGAEGDDEENFQDAAADSSSFEHWFLVIPGWAKVKITQGLIFKFNDKQRRVDFFSARKGPLALKLATPAEYGKFATQYRKCLFENTHAVEHTEENVNKVLGKDFAKSWDKYEDSDEVMWEAEDTFAEEKKKKETAAAAKVEDYKEALKGQSSPLGLAMGAMENSFLLHQSGIDVFKNEEGHVHSRGTTINLSGAGSYVTPRKGVLIRGETGMLLMSPGKVDKLHSSGLRQVDLEREKVVAEWKFQKDGVAINMRDVTNDSKGAQLDPNRSTFLGLDDNRLCRWDMRDSHGVVQTLAEASPSPVLTWDDGHQFARGTSFTCFATDRDGNIAVGSRDGKVRLYSTSSMRMAKTAFPTLGVPITSIDVTYDGVWVLATTPQFLVLLNTMWKDAKGVAKSAFTTRGGSKVAAPRILGLLPQHVAIAGANFHFEKGTFSWVTESGRAERHIVATVKNYSVIWDMRKLKQDHECFHQAVGLKACTCYTVRELDESVVDSKFMNDKFMSLSLSDAPLVVATPHKISSLQFQE